MLPGRHGQTGNIVQNTVLCCDGPHLRLHPQHIVTGDHLRHGTNGICALAVPEDGHLGLIIGITDGKPDKEPVHLGIGQQLGACGSYIVLGRDHRKGLLQRISCAVHRDLTFFHRFQQGGLGFAGRPVDLVPKQQVGIAHHAALVLKAAAVLVVNGKAHNIGRQHIRRELDAVIGQAQCAAQGHRQRCFADAGDIVQQNMSVGQQRHQDLFYDLTLAYHGLFHFNNDRLQFTVHTISPHFLPSLDKGRHGFDGQKCLHLTGMDFRVIFVFLRCRWAGAHQGEKSKKRRKDALSGVFALVERWYGFDCRTTQQSQVVRSVLKQ